MLLKDQVLAWSLAPTTMSTIYSPSDGTLSCKLNGKITISKNIFHFVKHLLSFIWPKTFLFRSTVFELFEPSQIPRFQLNSICLYNNWVRPKFRDLLSLHRKYFSSYFKNMSKLKKMFLRSFQVSSTFWRKTKSLRSIITQPLLYRVSVAAAAA